MKILVLHAKRDFFRISGGLFLFIFKDLIEFVFGSGVLSHHAACGFFNDVFGEADADAAVDFVVEFKSLTFISFKDFGDGAESNLVL